MDKAKIRLSQEEEQLVTNADWILTKNRVMQKAKYLLEDVQDRQQAYLGSHPSLLPPGIIKIPPKISRGENYRGLPWLILDYPRYFEKQNTFAIRTMFWWGRFFSITLHLSGENKRLYGQKLLNYLGNEEREQWYLCISDDEWQHHLEADNYRLLSTMDISAMHTQLHRADFLKLAKTFPIREWEEVGDQLLASFIKLVNWIGD